MRSVYIAFNNRFSLICTNYVRLDNRYDHFTIERVEETTNIVSQSSYRFLSKSVNFQNYNVARVNKDLKLVSVNT